MYIPISFDSLVQKLGLCIDRKSINEKYNQINKKIEKDFKSKDI